jgi:hypothetical protein
LPSLFEKLFFADRFQAKKLELIAIKTPFNEHLSGCADKEIACRNYPTEVRVRDMEGVLPLHEARKRRLEKRQ